MPGQKVNRNQLAAFLGHDVNTIDGYIAKGMPFLTKADRSRGIPWTFDTADVVRWLQDQLARSLGVDDSKSDLMEAQKRKAFADAELAELELKRRRSELIDARVVEQAVTTSYIDCKTRLMVIPSKLAPIIAGEPDVKKCKLLLETEIHQALNELGRYELDPFDGGSLACPPDGADVAASPPPTGKADSKRVGRQGKKAK